MSTAALTQAAAALWPEFRRILRRIGRWILKRLAERGSRWLLNLMRNRIDVRFPRQIAECIDKAGRARAEVTKRRWRMRRRRIQRRLARWQEAAAWIARNARRLTPAVLRHYEALSSKIPHRAPWEID